MATRLYEYIAEHPDVASKLIALEDFSKDIARIREEDVEDFTNLGNLFMRGRKVGKIPTSSTDVVDSDRVGDFNFDANFMYLCVDDSGAAWRRIILGVF